MPIVSQLQRRWLHKNKPQLAKEFEAHTPKGKTLPKKVKNAIKARTKRTRKKV